MVMPKKIVTFGRYAGLQEHSTGAMRAVLYDVAAHYRLGNCDHVLTSAVVKVDNDGEGNVVRVETLNTIYELRES
jgi:hypothetical protein